MFYFPQVFVGCKDGLYSALVHPNTPSLEFDKLTPTRPIFGISHGETHVFYTGIDKIYKFDLTTNIEEIVLIGLRSKLDIFFSYFCYIAHSHREFLRGGDAHTGARSLQIKEEYLLKFILLSESASLKTFSMILLSYIDLVLERKFKF